MEEFKITTQELMYYVSLIAMVLFFIQSKFMNDNNSADKLRTVDIMKIPSGSIIAVISRGVMGFFSDVLTFLAYNWTSYSKTQAIFFTNTLMIPFFALCMLKEPLRKQDIIAIVISFAGMILIIQPFKAVDSHGNPVTDFWGNFKSELVGIIFALLGAVTGALAVIFNSKAAKSVHFTTVAFWYMTTNVILCPIWSTV